MQATLERLRARREERGDEGGFTLIELLIVIVILGILAAIVVFAVQNLTSSSAQSSCRSDFKNVETAVEAYKAQMKNYPSGNASQETGPGNAGDGTTKVGPGASPTTDTELGAPIYYRAGDKPANALNSTLIATVTADQTSQTTGSTTSWNADTSVAPNAAGGSASELLVQGNTAPNNGGASAANLGPWLKDVPSNSGHYSIFVANDGSGTVSVLDGNGNVLAPTATVTVTTGTPDACSLIS